MKLIKGVAYSADISLNFIQRLASNEQVAAEFEKMGFINVTVSGSGKSRQVQGIWNGAEMEFSGDKRISNIKQL